MLWCFIRECYYAACDLELSARKMYSVGGSYGWVLVGDESGSPIKNTKIACGTWLVAERGDIKSDLNQCSLFSQMKITVYERVEDL